MKIAIVHDYIKEYGGAERVLEFLHEIWPEAPIFTALFLPGYLGPHAGRFALMDIRPSILQKLPLKEKLISPLRLLSGRVFENMNFYGYDAVIVSATGAYFPNFLTGRSDMVHFTYCHTPPRYLYGYPTARNMTKNAFISLAARFANHNLRIKDFLSYQRPDYIIANSHEVQRRVAKFYRRESTVIYPPVNTGNSLPDQGKREYYLAGGRLARAKNINLAIEACNKLNLPLKVFGRSFADYGQTLKKIAGPTVEFIGEVSDEKLAILYRGAKALIYPSEYEDFGIIPVEAQSFGTPVIAYASGGTLETVKEGKTGVFFHKLEVDDLSKAIRKAEKINFSRKELRDNALFFSGENFKRRIKSFILSKLK